MVDAFVSCGIVGPVLIVLTTVIAAARAPWYDPIRNTVSDLTAQNVADSLLLRIGLLAYGVLTVAFAVGLGARLPVLAHFVRAEISLFGASVGLVGIFQDYGSAPGAPRNHEGFLHNTFGLIAIASLLCAMVAVYRIASRHRQWQLLRNVTTGSLVIISLGALVFSFGPDAVNGLVELLIYGTALGWTARVALIAQHGEQRSPTSVSPRER
jgi:hypothetical membrane protein